MMAGGCPPCRRSPGGQSLWSRAPRSVHSPTAYLVQSSKPVQKRTAPPCKIVSITLSWLCSGQLARSNDCFQGALDAGSLRQRGCHGELQYQTGLLTTCALGICSRWRYGVGTTSTTAVVGMAAGRSLGRLTPDTPPEGLGVINMGVIPAPLLRLPVPSPGLIPPPPPKTVAACCAAAAVGVGGGVCGVRDCR